MKHYEFWKTAKRCLLKSLCSVLLFQTQVGALSQDPCQRNGFCMCPCSDSQFPLRMSQTQIYLLWGARGHRSHGHGGWLRVWDCGQHLLRSLCHAWMPLAWQVMCQTSCTCRLVRLLRLFECPGLQPCDAGPSLPVLLHADTRACLLQRPGSRHALWLPSL